MESTVSEIPSFLQVLKSLPNKFRLHHCKYIFI